MKVLVLNYTHPEGYPPTFNAINNLSKHFQQVFVLSTNTLDTKWTYDNNVHLTLLNAEKDRFKAVKISKWQKINAYFNYIRQLYLLIRKEKPELLLIYDGVPFFFYFIVSKFLVFNKKPFVWYHNHDIFPLSFYKKYSVNWFGALCEQKCLNLASVFSLPANERKEYFPMNTFKGKYLFIPNYPSKYFHGKLNIENKTINDKINIIYPGSICEKHGFEEAISILNEKIEDKEIHLTLLGDITDSYKNELLEIVKQYNNLDKLHFKSRVSYFDVPEVMKQQHIGWAVNKPLDVTYATGGTAANKIYEFLALGMPIILYDTENYRQYLQGNEWAFFSDLSKESLTLHIKTIISNYNQLSINARRAFENNFAFELAFEEALNVIKKEIKN